MKGAAVFWASFSCVRLSTVCGRYRLTKRRMLEIEDYYRIDDIRELDHLWQRVQHPAYGSGADHFRPQRKSAFGAGTVGPNLSWDRDQRRGEEGFHIQCEVGDSDDEADFHKRLFEETLHRPC